MSTTDTFRRRLLGGTACQWTGGSAAVLPGGVAVVGAELSVEVGQVRVADSVRDRGHGQRGAAQQLAGLGEPEPADRVGEGHAGDAREVAGERGLRHADVAGGVGQTQVGVAEVGEDVAEGEVDAVGDAVGVVLAVRRPLRREVAPLVVRCIRQGSPAGEDVAESSRTLGDADRVELLSGRVPGGAENSMPRRDRRSSVRMAPTSGRRSVQRSIHCGWNWKTTSRSGRRSPGARSLIQWWGTFEPTKDELPGAEDVDAVPDDVPAGAGGDQMQLVLRVMVPAGERSGHPMAMPPRGVVRDRSAPPRARRGSSRDGARSAPT